MKFEVSSNKIFSLNGSNKKEIHPFWLRERVSEKEHLDKGTQQRLFDPSAMKHSVEIINAEIKGEYLKVKFNDGVDSKFEIKKLSDELSLNSNEIINIEKVKWKSDFKNIKSFKFSDKFADSKEMLNLLINFYKYGFVIVQDVPTNDNFLVNFGNMIGSVKRTNFGEHFNVKSKPNPNDLAYTALELKSHSDNPYRKPVPGIQLLHCIANESSGGDSSLVDGYSVSKYLENNYKEYFKILTETNVNFKFTDVDVILENKSKIIELDNEGNFKQISFSGRLDYVPLLENKKLETFYNARKLMYELCNSDQFKIKFRLNKGMIAMFDNLRLLHGRTKFDPNTGFRHLQGCYLDHDATEGKLRRLLK